MPEPNWTRRDGDWYVWEPYPRFSLNTAGERIPGSSYSAFQLRVHLDKRLVVIHGTGHFLNFDATATVDGCYLGGLLASLRQVAEYFNELDVQPEARPAPRQQDQEVDAIDLDLDDTTVGATHIRLVPLTEAPRE